MDQKVVDLISLVRRRYPDWDGFDHPPFTADEVEYKQATIAKASDLISEAELRRLIAEEKYEELIGRLDKLAQDNNLLWRRVPMASDANILYQSDLDEPLFCSAMLYLLYGDLPTPERIERFTNYTASADLPNKWPFVTYFLFICHPERELFVKPQAAKWFLTYMGRPQAYSQRPSAPAYAALLESAAELRDALQPYHPHDMVDVQSFIWVAFRESGESTAGLDTKAQIELDQPAAEDAIAPALALRERETTTVYNPQSVPFHPSVAPSLASIAEATGFSESDLLAWLQAIERKGQAILYGPPGTGKTFLAEKLAHYLVSGGNGFYDLVQFHPAYSYEEFIQGIRPQSRADGSLAYPVLPGRFLEFCHEARLRSGRCVLIIDEINRANLSRVFGELMYLLEYRDRDIPLAGGGRLAIPANVYLIGTMNTADRSIALVDYALRRRFAFLPLLPNYDLLRRYHAQTGFDPTGLIKLLTRLNNQIGDPHYAVGITFFLRPDLPQHLENIWRTEIEPYLEEYFYDRPEQVTVFRWPTIQPHL
jgi:hypothetical protein